MRSDQPCAPANQANGCTEWRSRMPAFLKTGMS